MKTRVQQATVYRHHHPPSSSPIPMSNSSPLIQVLQFEFGDSTPPIIIASASSDIFLVIDKAILVAATDDPRKLASRTDRIVETLYTGRRDPCSGFDLQAPEGIEAAMTGDAVGKVNSSCGETPISCINETKVLTDVVKKENQAALDEILRINKVLDMKERLEIAKRNFTKDIGKQRTQRTIKILEINEIPREGKKQRKPYLKPPNNIPKMLKGRR